MRCIFKNIGPACETQSPYLGCLPVNGPTLCDPEDWVALLAEIETEQADRKALSNAQGVCQ